MQEPFKEHWHSYTHSTQSRFQGMHINIDKKDTLYSQKKQLSGRDKIVHLNAPNNIASQLVNSKFSEIKTQIHSYSWGAVSHFSQY